MAACMRACAHANGCVCLYMWARTKKGVHVSRCAHMCVNVHAHTRVPACVCVCVCVCDKCGHGLEHTVTRLV